MLVRKNDIGLAVPQPFGHYLSRQPAGICMDQRLAPFLYVSIPAWPNPDPALARKAQIRRLAEVSVSCSGNLLKAAQTTPTLAAMSSCFALI